VRVGAAYFHCLPPCPLLPSVSLFKSESPRSEPGFSCSPSCLETPKKSRNRSRADISLTLTFLLLSSAVQRFTADLWTICSSYVYHILRPSPRVLPFADLTELVLKFTAPSLQQTGAQIQPNLVRSYFPATWICNHVFIRQARRETAKEPEEESSQHQASEAAARDPSCPWYWV
jgi:hypothetical protein